MMKTQSKRYKLLGTMSHATKTKWDFWKFYVSNRAKTQPWQNTVDLHVWLYIITLFQVTQFCFVLIIGIGCWHYIALLYMYHYQGSHRLEKNLNMQDCLEKSLKIKFALKSTGKTLKGLEKSLNFTIYRRIQT